MRNKLNKHLLLAIALLLASAAQAGPDDGAVGGATAIVDNGSDGERFDLVILSEGYTDEQMDQFAVNAEAFADYFLNTPPFSYNCSAFNIWRVDVTSTEAGADDPSGCADGTGAEAATFFDGTFCADGVNRRLLRVSESTVIDVLNAAVPGWDQAVVLVNSEIYGGSGGSVAVGSLSGSWERIAIHEIGHSAFGLADEYEYWAGCDIDVDRDVHPDVEPAEANVTTASERSAVKWAYLIDDETPVPTTENADCEQCDPQENPNPRETVVGLYEGAHYFHCDGYRPAFDGMMRNFGHFCPVCTERILETLEPFQPVNTPPVCDAGGPYEAECAGATTGITLDGSASTDADCDLLEFAWAGDFEEETAEGETADVNFAGVGEFGVDLAVSDSDAESLCSTTAAVTDTIAPVITIDDVEAECESPDGTAVELGDPVVEEVCDADPVVGNDAPELFPLGETVVTWTATDASSNTGSTEQNVSVVDTTPPSIEAPGPVTEECSSPDGTPVDLGEPVVSDICDADVEVINDAPELFPLGETIVTWTATDDSGNASTATQLVTVADTTPPDLAMSVSPDALWPPNHRMKWITASIEVSDICDADPEVYLVSIVSNEPVNANGDGNTEPDIDEADYGTDDREFRVRAERAGPGEDRIYTVTYQAEDDSGNTMSAEDSILVPHDQGNNDNP